jgi:hypothetical protein
MITTDMRFYDYFTFGSEDEYGQETLSTEPVGKVKMAINITSQSVQDNINYKNSQYIGLTHAKVDDTYVIQYGEERLKVLYVNPLGRYNQVFLTRM